MERCASASRAGKFHSVHRFGKKRKKSLIANTTKRRAAPAASVEDGRSSAPSIAAAEPAGVGLTAPPACESASGSGRVRIDTKILQPAELHENARNAEAKLQELASISATTRKQDRLAAAGDGAAADSADNVSFVVINLDCVNDLLSIYDALRHIRYVGKNHQPPVVRLLRGARVTRRADGSSEGRMSGDAALLPQGKAAGTQVRHKGIDGQAEGFTPFNHLEEDIFQCTAKR
ncbi:hypothetical protein MRX96_023602 [Rhipicephalus microplus]